MKITGKITHIFDAKSGISKDGKNWKSLEYRLEEINIEYPNSLILTIFGEDKIANFIKYNKVNDVLEVDFNIKTNEYNGNFYNKINSFRTEKIKNGSKQNEPIVKKMPQ